MKEQTTAMQGQQVTKNIWRCPVISEHEMEGS